MSKARNIADAFDANGDVAVSALDNVPPNTALVDSSDNTVLDTSSGVLSANGQIVTGADGISMQDNERLYVGSGDDLQIYHDGTHSRIVDSGTGSLVVQATDLIIQDGGSTEQMARFYKDAQVDLSYNGSTRLSTTSTGAKVWGDLAVTGAMPSGTVIQQRTTSSTSVLSWTNASGAFFTDYNYVKKNSANPLIISGSMCWSGNNPNGYWELQYSDNNGSTWTNISNLFEADEAPNHPSDLGHFGFSITDTANVPQRRYRVYWWHIATNGGTMYRNRVYTMQSWSGPGRGVSSITVTEVQA